MDLGIVIIGSILIAVSVVPFVIINYSSVKKENKKIELLTKIALQHNCKISQHELCGDFVIGLDENKKFLFFIKQKEKELTSQCVDLKEFQICHTEENTKTIQNKEEDFIKTESVALCFKPINKDKSETKLILYDEEKNNMLSGELLLAEKISKKINALLKTKK